MAKVALIGTGGMGRGMGYSLLRAGHELVVCNRTVAKTRPLLQAGASVAATPGEAVRDAEAIFVMVGDDADSRAAWLSPAGILAGHPAPSALAIECSTLSPAWVRELAAAARAAGLAFIDCPVTGGRQGAEAGTLTLLVGAEPEDLERARPVLASVSREIIHFGPPGAGTAYKLVANLLVGVQAAALAEALLLAERSGLDLTQVVAALGQSAAASPVVKAYAPRMVANDHGEPIGFVARWMHKDMLYGLRLAAEAGQSMPTASVAAAVHQLAVSRGFGDQDVTAVIQALR